MRTIIFAAQPSPEWSNTEERLVAGIVMLSKPPSETGPFRGIVEKLLVSPSFRRRGVATTLMVVLEEVARAEGRPLLVSLFFCLNWAVVSIDGFCSCLIRRREGGRRIYILS